MTGLDRVECLYPSGLFGCIIGEAGARIKEVREKHAIKIYTDKKDNHLRFR